MILVVGATGLLGGMVTRRLLKEKQSVRILVRRNSPSEELAKQGRATSAQELIALGAQPVSGDLTDTASLDAACKEVEVVISTANSAVRGGNDNPESVDFRGTCNLVDSARGAGVRQFIYVSALGADPDSPVPFIAAKGKAAEYLRSRGLSYTILMPTPFMDIWIAMLVGSPAVKGQPVTVVGSGERKHSFVHSADVASFILAAVRNPNAQNQQLPIGGPEAFSLRDAARAFGRVLGRDIPVNSIAPGKPVPGLPESVWGLAAGLDMYESVLDMNDLSSSYGVTLTPLEKFAQEMVKNAAS